MERVIATRTWEIALIGLLVLTLFGIIGFIIWWGLKTETAALLAAWATIVGVVIAQIVNARVARSGRIQAQELANQNAREAALQNYFEQIGKLLIDQSSRLHNPGDEVRTLARAHTLAILQELDSERKRDPLQFLNEAGLIRHDPNDPNKRPIVNLKIADLVKADLTGAILHGANLSRAYMREAKIQDADLVDTNLSEVDLYMATIHRTSLRNALLRKANLKKADLNSSNLSGADLRDADLKDADLSGATLEGTNLSGADLRGARGLTKEQVKQAIVDKATRITANGE